MRAAKPEQVVPCEALAASAPGRLFRLLRGTSREVSSRPGRCRTAIGEFQPQRRRFGARHFAHEYGAAGSEFRSQPQPNPASDIRRRTTTERDCQTTGRDTVAHIDAADLKPREWFTSGTTEQPVDRAAQ